MKQIEWYGLYSESWQGEIVPEAFSHPAKYSRAMIRQVYQHMIDMGYIKAGDRIVDPFGGVGLGAFDAMKHGLHWEGCELEPRFVELGNQNLGLWQSRYAGWFANWGTAVLRQGDSRQLTQVIGEAAACVSSSPYASDTVHNRNGIDLAKTQRPGQNSQAAKMAGYGKSDGQLSNMPPGDFDAVVSSSPYGDAVQAGDGPGARWDEATHPNNPDKVSSAAEYGRTPGQLGNMRMDAAVSSPPFEASLSADRVQKNERVTLAREMGVPVERVSAIDMEKVGQRTQEYGSTPGNIGNDSGATFWTAARDIVQQVHEVLKPGGYGAFVCGDFVRKGERVYFGKQWLDLCTAVGFEPVEWITCWKTEYKGTQLDIFGGENHKQVDRVSFFRRLANEKNPDAAILNEDVIIVRKPVVS